MDILRICVTVMCNTSTRPFKNLPDELSVPVAMFTMSDLSEDLRWSWFEFFEMLICYYSGQIYFIIKLQEPQETFLHFKQLYVEGNLLSGKPNSFNVFLGFQDLQCFQNLFFFFFRIGFWTAFLTSFYISSSTYDFIKLFFSGKFVLYVYLICNSSIR